MSKRAVLPEQHSSYRWIALLLGAIAIARIASTIPVFSQIIDEPSGIGTGAAMLGAKRHVIGVQHPPLARLPAAIGVRLAGVTLPDYAGATNIGKEDESFAAGTTALFDRGVPYWRVLIWARVPMLIFPALALLYLWLLTARLTNQLTASLAVALFSFDAALLGNGMWVGNDVAACAGFLAAIYHGIRWIEMPTIKLASFAGIACAVAVGVKFSTVLAIPSLLIIALLHRIALRRILAHALFCGLVSFLTLWAIYWFDFGTMGNSTVLGTAREWAEAPRWLKETPVPMPSFWLGLVRLLGHNREGHPGMFLGQVGQFGWWYFFPFIFAVKTAVAILGALLCATILWLTGRARWKGPASAIVIPPLVFLIVAMTGNLSLGIRYLLPMLPFVYFFIAWQFAKRGHALILIALGAFAAVETAMVHPDYIAFFNSAAGGTEKSARIVVGSDIDWGQDVYRLAEYLQSPEARGRSYTLRLSGLRQEPLVKALGLDPTRLTAKPEGLYCINKRARLMELDHKWLNERRLVKRIGASIDVYDLDATINDER